VIPEHGEDRFLDGEAEVLREVEREPDFRIETLPDIKLKLFKIVWNYRKNWK